MGMTRLDVLIALAATPFEVPVTCLSGVQENIRHVVYVVLAGQRRYSTRR